MAWRKQKPSPAASTLSAFLGCFTLSLSFLLHWQRTYSASLVWLSSLTGHSPWCCCHCQQRYLHDVIYGGGGGGGRGSSGSRAQTDWLTYCACWVAPKLICEQVSKPVVWAVCAVIVCAVSVSWHRPVELPLIYWLFVKFTYKQHTWPWSPTHRVAFWLHTGQIPIRSPLDCIGVTNVFMCVLSSSLDPSEQNYAP